MGLKLLDSPWDKIGWKQDTLHVQSEGKVWPVAKSITTHLFSSLVLGRMILVWLGCLW